MSLLLPVNAIRARCAAFNHGQFLAGKIVPSTLRGPVVGRHLDSATQAHTSTGSRQSKLANGISYLHVFFPFAIQEDRTLRSPLEAERRRWIWWFIRERVCCSRSSYRAFHSNPSADGRFQKNAGQRLNERSCACAGHCISALSLSDWNRSTFGYDAHLV